jgi:diguanylate cyclase (GGDEF)-like protein
MASDFIEHMCSVVGVCLENHLNLEMINRSSLIDTLTGVNNRHFLEQRLGEEIARAQRSIEPLCCLALDIDDFRQVNVNYGHQVGDQFLIAIAAAIREQLRNNDLLVRYSGEKFIALLINTEAEQAEEIAQRIRELVKQIQINQIQIDQVVSVTISIGISIYKTSYSSQQKPAKVKVNLLRKAEKALDKAKKDGKDRVVMTDIVTDPMSIANLFKSRSVS